MKKRAGVPLSMFAELEPDASGAPLHRRTYRRIRQMILDGVLTPGRRLPSTRTLAADLGVSRNTVELAFSQLRSEGYIVRRVGSGSYVSSAMPNAPIHARRGRRSDDDGPVARTGSPRRRIDSAALSKRGRVSATAPPGPEADADATFGVCRPGLDAFPLHIWNRLLLRRARRAGRELLDECPPMGLDMLRAAIAEYLIAARGVRCDAKQVIVLTSTQQGLDLAARLLLDPGQSAWIEEPCYTGAKVALRNAGIRTVPIRVDDDGLDVERGMRIAPDARLAYVTPSHQFPLGVTMGLERRLALLRWAERADAWIIEDDYDSEFRYVGRPLAALQGLDDGGRVLYIGTFNKAMFPSLRLAYMVVPSDLVDAFSAARRWIDGHSSALVQAVMTDFMVAGHFGVHIRHMREVYRARRDALRAAIDEFTGERIRLGPANGGMHAVGWLERGTDVNDLCDRAAREALYLRDVAVYYAGAPAAPGLVLNFASASPTSIRRGVRTLSTLL
jgi:GntR family transcriptional regulator/MocR family aminotransferase